jgi:hypothetical protein
MISQTKFHSEIPSAVADLASTTTKTCAREPYEIVPQALRHRLGWDARHDLMAVRIIAEFKLALPRDRELIRQLAILRVAQPDNNDGNGA